VVDRLAEDALQIRDRLVDRGSLQIGRAERSLVALRDERAGGVVEAIAVDLEEAVPVLLEKERERVEEVGGAEPDVARAALLQRGLESLGVAGAETRRDAVAGDHQVPRVRLDIV
jgi:hypothetical protein